MFRIFKLQLLWIFIVSAAGCKPASDNYGYPDSDIIYGKAEQIYGEKLPAEYVTASHLRNRITPYGLIGLAEMNGKFVHLSDMSTGEILVSAVNKGRGPAEMLSASYPDYYAPADKFFAADPFKNQILEHKITQDTILVTNGYDIRSGQSSFLGGFSAASDSTFILLLHRFDSHCLMVLDTNRMVVDSLNYTVFDDDRIDHSKVQYLSISMGISPDRKTLVLYDRWYNCLKKYKVDNNKLSLEKDTMFIRPFLDLKNGIPLAKDNHLQTLGNVFLTDRYILVVSNPETVKQEKEREKEAKEKGGRLGELMNRTYLLIFDYNLNFVTSYLCDGHFNWIAVMPDGKTLYASDYEKEFSIKKYILPY